MKFPQSSLPAVLVLARYWKVGPVKTRLAADIGQNRARKIYRKMVEKLWNELHNPLLQRHLWVSPQAELEACGSWLQGANKLMPQPQGDLGARLIHAFEAAKSSPWAAVIGTDCPALDAATVLTAGANLAHADVAITPTFDGGYALLALRSPQPELFQDIPWSTPQVLDATLDCADRLGLKVVLGQTLRDLDDLNDLRILQAEGLVAPSKDR